MRSSLRSISVAIYWVLRLVQRDIISRTTENEMPPFSWRSTPFASIETLGTDLSASLDSGSSEQTERSPGYRVHFPSDFTPSILDSMAPPNPLAGRRLKDTLISDDDRGHSDQSAMMLL